MAKEASQMSHSSGMLPGGPGNDIFEMQTSREVEPHLSVALGV